MSLYEENDIIVRMKNHSHISGTLLDALAAIAPESSKNTLRSWIDQGRIKVDGQIVTVAKSLVAIGQLLELGTKSVFLDHGIEVLFEDRDIIVIDKPVGLLSVATESGRELSAHEILKRRFHTQRVFPVHRLDRETSGVMLFAYSEEARDRLKEDFASHNLVREYIAIIKDRCAQNSGTWESYLFDDANYNVRQTDDPQRGQLAITHYEVISRSARHSALRLRLETGRKNQIRVHCQSAGHSILGDKKYGGAFAKRLFLHARLLEITHPVKGKKLSFTSPIPPLFLKIIDIK
jgi:tRNA pseudouridine32 synthase/23S rRNA pseudouridine746 synthase/23S rRNA pseudouridine1911/1915/1917 synthase